MKKLKIGVIGLGSIAQLVHIPILKKLHNVEIEAICDTDRNKLNAISKKFDISKKYLSFVDLLNDKSTDAVIIATPTNTHCSIAVAAAEAGKHMLIEKPAATTPEETIKIDEAVKKNNVTAMVGMNQRFRPDSMLIKSLINSGELGEIFYIRVAWLRKKSSSENWFTNKNESGGGVLFDLGIPLLDLAQWFLGKSETSGGAARIYKHQVHSVEDSAVGLLTFGNASLSFEVSWSLFTEKEKMAVTVYGTEGTAHLNPFKAYKRVGATRIDLTSANIAGCNNVFSKSYENELKHFIGAVSGNNPVISSVAEARDTMNLVNILYNLAE